MIRRWTERDAIASYAVYASAVLDGADSFYNKAQREAWVPSRDMEDWWTPRLSAGSVWISEDADGLTGLIALRPDGYLDLFFILPRARGDGTAAALYEAFIEEARNSGMDKLRAHASEMLLPFLQKRGWRVITPEDVPRSGVTLRRYEMALDQVGESQVS